MSRSVLAALVISSLAGPVCYCLASPALGAAAAAPWDSAELLCRPAIIAAERAHAVPPGLMTAVGRVESGRRDPASGVTNPWPWTINAEGQGAFFDTKAQAIAAVRALQDKGVRSIDVGCMQVNLMHHPDAFANLEAAFDPTVNADYAGRFLTELYEQTHAWPAAVARYHSATPELGAAYQRQVMAIWPEEQGAPVVAAASSLQRAWAATLSTPPPLHRGEGWHFIMQAATPDHPVTPGRGLDSYRSRPVMMATRSPIRDGG